MSWRSSWLEKAFCSLIAVFCFSTTVYGIPCEIIITTTSPLSSGTVGAAYSVQLSAEASAGPTPTLSFSIQSGTPPQGLMLSTSGLISGIPTLAGVSNFDVVAQGGTCDPSDPTPFQITINCSAFTFVPSGPDLPPGTFGVPYSEAIQVTGGNGNYTFSFDPSSGPLPNGLSLSPSGVISGIPTQVGTFNNIVIDVSDTSTPTPCTGTVTYSLDITCGLINFVATTLPQGAPGIPYSATIEVTGGLPPFTFSLTSGALPPGLTLNADGTITGTPTEQGVFSFGVLAVDSNECSAEATFTITIVCGPTEIVTKRLPDAKCGIYYDQQIEATGFTPILFRVKQGELPDDLELVPTTGRIQGFPRERGKFRFTIQATSACGSSGERKFTIESCR
ncbi:MAG TPA: Ig domain-containing protein [Myxococcota bacterium]|nr:Ig domain-containing protein [Myxococcota bacterium]